MGRLYLCPVVGTGTREDPQRVAIGGLPPVAGVTALRAVIATESDGPSRGKPRHGWALCWVEATDWTAVEATDGVIHLTGEVLDDPVPAPIRNAVTRQTNLTRAEVDAAGTVRGLIEVLLQRHQDRPVIEVFPELGSI